MKGRSPTPLFWRLDVWNGINRNDAEVRGPYFDQDQPTRHGTGNMLWIVLAT